MYRNYRIIPFIPAGRERTLRHLTTSLLRFRNNPVDEVYLWRNTQEQSDLAYIDSLKNDYFKVFNLPPGQEYVTPKQLNTGKYYVYTQDQNTIYIRFDDDIVYVDDQYFKNLLDFRIDNPDYFLVMGNIWNNAIISYLHQRMGHIGLDQGLVQQDYCMDETGWRNPLFAEYIHRILLTKIKEGNTKDLFFDRWELHNAKRFSISNFCYFGRDMAKFNGIVKFEKPEANARGCSELDEETWLTEYYPKVNNKLNAICGSALCAHFTFLYQRPHILQNTDFLQQYLDIAQNKLSANYYSFVES